MTTDILPLSGVKVLDLSAYIAGPYGCTLLGDLGADVIKVEPPEGDNLRKYPSTIEAESRAFLGLNRNKRGLCLDLKNPDGHAVLIRLVRQADVLVHNFRPGVPERLRIDFETLRAANPRLVYCAMTGYGDRGPLARNAGYDQVMQSMTGMCASQGKAGGPPEILYGSIVDYYGASMIAGTVASALYQRERTGAGLAVQVSLLGSALCMQSARLVWADGEPRDIERDMRSGGITGIHPTKDGYIYLSANTPHFWHSLCEHLGLAELADDERYDSVKKRAVHAGVLVSRVRAALAGATAHEWAAKFGQSVPCSVVNRVENMFDDPQVQAMDFMGTYANERVGGYRGLARWASFDGDAQPAAGRHEGGAPGLGEHSRQVLRDLGYDETAIDRLFASTAVR
ncbi:MAG TPA: CoA transferase [Bordetella sp.]